jgi:3-hydroxypropanoate dehydrogenase
MMLEQPGLDLLFNRARSQNGWQAKSVSEAQLAQLYDLTKMGPTSLNCSPARFVFVVSSEAKQRLVEAVSDGNVEKTRTAPVVVVIGYSLDFPSHLPVLFPHNPNVAALFEGKPDFVQDTAYRNSSLQGAYLMMAARAMGLDCGPMSGFNHEKVERTFFPDDRVKVNFLCGIGYGDPTKVFSRSPRLSFDEACNVV